MQQDTKKQYMNNVTHKKVLAVEGKDECNFFKALFDDMGITEYQIYDIGGKTEFKAKIPALVKTSELDFDKVEVFAIIRDADDNHEGAFESISSIVKKAGLKEPLKVDTFGDGNPKVGIFIMPGNSKNGMLEDLCLQTVEDKPVMKHVDHYIDCVQKIEDGPKIIAKAKAQVYLASKPVTVYSVGLGAQKKYWDFTSNTLDDLKEFLENMR